MYEICEDGFLKYSKYKQNYDWHIIYKHIHTIYMVPVYKYIYTNKQCNIYKYLSSNLWYVILYFKLS